MTRFLSCLVLLAALLPALFPGRASACSCMAQSVEEAMASSTAIFEARVVSVVTEGESRSVTLAVTQAWRGVESEEVVVRTHASSAACGYDFAPDVTYLVYATGEPGALAVSLCSRTAPILEAAADRAALGSGVIPVDITDEAVEPVRPARTEPPARGGCASCSVQTANTSLFSLALPALLVAILARRKNRP